MAIATERQDIVDVLENYNEAFGKADYSDIVNYFDYPASFNLQNKTIGASGKFKLKLIYKKIRGDLPDYYSYSKWDKIDIQFENKATVCKYAVPEGYPDKPIKNKPIDVSKVKNPDLLFYASVDIKGGVLVESGSRTVATVGISNSISSAEKIAEESISSIEGPLFHRTDIGTPLLIEKRKRNMDSLR